LVISSLFPTQKAPHRGIFVPRQAKLLEAQGVQSSFIVPHFLNIWPLSRSKRFQEYADLPKAPAWLNASDVRGATYLRPPGERFQPYEAHFKMLPVLACAQKWHATSAFDVILGVDMTADARVAVATGRFLGLPVATLAIGSDVMTRPHRQPLLKKHLRRTLEHADLTFGVSEAICRELTTYNVPNFTPIRVYLGRESYSHTVDRLPMREALGFSPDDKVAIYVGALTTPKGIGDLIAACEPLICAEPNFRILLVGDGPLRDLALRKLASRVHVTGWVNPNEIQNYLGAADLMVFPSHSEGIPQAILEAMRSELPIIATRVGGIPEAIVDRRTGLLVSAHDPASLKNAILQMLHNRDLRSHYAQEARKHVNDMFDPTTNAQRMADDLRALLRS